MIATIRKQLFLGEMLNFIIGEVYYHRDNKTLTTQLQEQLKLDYETCCSIINDYGIEGYTSFEDAILDAAKTKGGLLC
jgi:hypothetical protein